MKDHSINQNISLLEALAIINSLAPEPLVLFVIDNENHMVGTLTDGDSRRALIAGASVNDKAEKIMHRNFNYMRADDAQNVQEIQRQKKMPLGKFTRRVKYVMDDIHSVDLDNMIDWKFAEFVIKENLV